MKLYWQILKLILGKLFLRRQNGELIRNFAENMGIVYIKLAQMLATQNFGNLFTEEDRLKLSSICDDCNPIDFAEIQSILQREYDAELSTIFASIDEQPVGSASVSQVHHAILRTGEEVVIKVKRQDVARTIEHDLATIKKLVHRFGCFVKFRNFSAGDYALNLYLEWIRQETDFLHEQQNIKTYQAFADNVNGRIRGTKRIKVPKLYEEYCTSNVIVMEYVKAPTINRLPLTAENKTKVATAFNSYIKSSFWALFNDETIVFHGDPHSGNICVDDAGDIWFLDMGLLCALDPTEAKLCRDFFMTAYAGNYEKLFTELAPYGKMNERERESFRRDCRAYCEAVHQKEVTSYFVDMLNVCLRYEIVPPDFLFHMAKAFVCLNGISNFTDNKCSARELLEAQTVEFLLKRSLNDCQQLIVDHLRLVPETLTNVFDQGIAGALSQLITDRHLEQHTERTLTHLREALDLFSISYHDRMSS